MEKQKQHIDEKFKGKKLAISDMRIAIPDSPSTFIKDLNAASFKSNYTPQRNRFTILYDRDECYVITQGSGEFIKGDQRDLCNRRFSVFRGWHAHKFVNFGAVMECWVIFYGPMGGNRS